MVTGMGNLMGLSRPTAPAAELEPPAGSRAAVRTALLTPLQLVPFVLVPVFLFSRSHGWVADVPIWVLIGSVFAAQWGSNVAFALWPPGCRTWQMVLRVGVMVCGVALAMYATGWGPVFAFGYVFAAAENIRVDGSRVARPVIAWMVGATVLGQVGIGLGWIPSLVPQQQVQGAAVLAVFGSALVIVLLQWSTAAKEDATALTETFERRFRALVQSSSDLVFVVDLTGAVTYASPSCTDVLGYEPELLLGHESGILVH